MPKMMTGDVDAIGFRFPRQPGEAAILTGMSDSQMDPSFTSRIRFRMGDVFPSDDPVARWIINLARASNDLLIANGRLLRGLEDGTPEEEHLYDIRAISTHSWELATFIRESERDHAEVASFIERLAPEPVQDFRDVLNLIDADPVELKPGKMWSFGTALATARNQFTHYSKIGRRQLGPAIKRVETEEGELLLGESFKDFRAQFAAAVDAQIFHPLEKKDPESFKKFLSQLQLVVGGLIRFSSTAVQVYLLEQGERITIEAVSSDR